MCVYAQEVVSLYKKTHAIIKVLTAHWATSFITSRPVCVYSCSQLRELWFNDIMHMYIIHVHNIVGKMTMCNSKCIYTIQLKIKTLMH